MNNEFKDKLSLVILIGAPASGKSTWGKKCAADNNMSYVSTDSIRAEIGSGEGDQSVSAAAWNIAAKRVTQSLSSGKSVVVDATNIDQKMRKGWIKTGREHKAFIVGVTFEVAKEELYRRNDQRERKVGHDIIDGFVARFKKPGMNEVDKIISV